MLRMQLKDSQDRLKVYEGKVSSYHIHVHVQMNKCNINTFTVHVTMMNDACTCTYMCIVDG